MIPDMSEDEYISKVYTKVVQAMVTLDSDGTEVGGFVEPGLALQGLCMVVGAVAAQARPDMTQKEVRATADWCRKLVVTAIQATLKDKPSLEQTAFRFDPVKRH